MRSKSTELLKLHNDMLNNAVGLAPHRDVVLERFQPLLIARM